MSTKNTWRHWPNDESDLPPFERIKHSQNHPRDPENVQDDPEYIPRRNRFALENPAFRCCHCKAWVESDPELAGVKHRNHCPYCLYSRHLDELKPGDRRSDCHAGMRPIGLTLKASHNKFASDDGELMLIHQCLGCGKLSINRIAADDNAERIMTVFESSASLSNEVRSMLARQGIHLLGTESLNIVLTRLFGKGEAWLQRIPAEQVKLDYLETSGRNQVT